MELSLFDRGRRAHMENRFCWFLLCVIAVGAILLMPLSYWVTSDVLLQDTVLPMLVDFLIELCNYVFFWGSFAVVLYVIYRYGFASLRSTLLLYVGAVVIRYLAYLLAGYVVLGFPETINDAWQDDLVYLLLDVLMDLLQMGVLLLAAYFFMERNRPPQTLKRPYPAWLPYERPLGLGQNPLLASVAVAAVLPAVIRLFSRIRYDIAMGGAVGLSDLLWQIFAYFSDVVYLAAGYLLLLLALNSLFLKDEEAYELYSTEEGIGESAEKK